MPVNIDDLLPTAKEIQKQAAIKEAEKAEQHAQRLAAAEAEKRALIERLSKPSGPHGGREGETRVHRYPACGPKRPHRGSGLPFPELVVH